MPQDIDPDALAAVDRIVNGRSRYAMILGVTCMLCVLGMFAIAMYYRTCP